MDVIVWMSHIEGNAEGNGEFLPWLVSHNANVAITVSHGKIPVNHYKHQ
jgi:hypothetical protein